jgi:hypothetical protein
MKQAIGVIKLKVLTNDSYFHSPKYQNINTMQINLGNKKFKDLRSPKKKKKKKKSHIREENQPIGKSPMKNITNFPLLKPEMTFFSSPFHILPNIQTNNSNDSYINQNEICKLIFKTTAFYISKYIEKEEYPNFSSVLFEHLQTPDHYQFKLPTIFINEVFLPHM